MCINKRFIVNPYTKRSLYVNCGYCPACLQEKAIRRVRRIKNTESDANECMMVSLTYARGCVPYIDRSEAYNFAHGRLSYLNVYRDYFFRRVRIDSSYDFEYRSKPGKVVLEKVPFEFQVDFDKNKDLKHERGKIGVAFYPDVQAFVARLRLNLKRLYNYDGKFKTFCCSEYGTKSLRPHFHLLVFYPKGDFEVLRSAIIKSWPFSRLQDFPRSIEKCYRGASYVASYVNCGTKFPVFLKSYFKPKHSYSKGFGLANRNFTLSAILSAYERGSLSYGVLKSNGKTFELSRFLIPKYVIHRYFPKFKGYSRIDPLTLYDNMRRLAKGEFDEFNKSVTPLYLSDVECLKVHTRLNNAFARFVADKPDCYPSTFDDYYLLHINIWNMYNSNLLRFNMENDDVFLFEKYDNLEEVDCLVRRGDMRFPVGFTREMLSNHDPNKYPHNVVKDYSLRNSFHTNIKHRAVTNAVLSQISEEW